VPTDAGIEGSGVLLTKTRKKSTAEKYFFIKATIKDVQATKEAFSPQTRTSSISNHKISFLWVIYVLLDPNQIHKRWDRAGRWGGGGGSNTDKKENRIFLINKEIQNGAVAMSNMNNGLLIYGEIFAHFLIY
jgi:hypothetical protein